MTSKRERELTTAEAVESGSIVVLYASVLPDIAQAKTLAAAWLTSDEHDRFERFIPDDPRIGYLAGRILLRRTLGQLLRCEPLEVRLRVARHGKLELAVPRGNEGVQFNLTHTRRCVAAAFSKERVVGVDVERFDPRHATLSVAREVFSSSENAALEGLDEDAYLKTFFRLWTLKEAYVKARGLGLGIPLRDCGFELPGEIGADIVFAARRRVDRKPERWGFRQVEIEGRWVLAVCFDRDERRGTDCVFRESWL